MDGNNDKDFIQEKSFLQEWISNPDHFKYPYPQINYDITDLITALATLGFSNIKAEYPYDYTADPPSEENSEITVECTCKRSGIKFTMKRVVPLCTCPTPLDLIDVIYWLNLDPNLPLNLVSRSKVFPRLPLAKAAIFGNLLRKIFIDIHEIRQQIKEQQESSEDSDSLNSELSSSDSSSSVNISPVKLWEQKSTGVENLTNNINGTHLEGIASTSGIPPEKFCNKQPRKEPLGEAHTSKVCLTTKKARETIRLRKRVQAGSSRKGRIRKISFGLSRSLRIIRSNKKGVIRFRTVKFNRTM